MAEALREMGVKVTEPDATTFVVEGTGVLQQPESRFSSAMPVPPHGS